MDSFKVQDVVPFEGRFPSWEAFDVARKAHCEKTHTLYVCRNTVKVAIANKRRKLQVPDHWVYDRKVYVCTHGYRRISRSSGSRPRQKVRYTNCKARFTASVVSEVINNAEVLCIKITGQHLEHDDHPVSLDQWRNYSQNRASIVEHPYLIHEAELMRRIGSNKRMAREHIETLSGKVCTMKDMHNLYARLKKREDGIKTNSALVDENPAVRVESVLQQFVDAHVENHVSILSADDGSNEAMCLSSKAMKEHFQVFPELCLLDVTICQSFDMDGYQMQGFLSMDALGNAKPVFLAQSSNTSASLFRRICRDFKRTHPKWTEIKILVMDKLHPEVVDVLHHEFPNAQVLLCQFHAIKFLTSLVSQVEFEIPNLQLQEQVRELMKQMVFANTHQAYNESKALLLQHLGNREDHPLLVHIDQHWEPYRNLWASYWRGIVLEFSAFFTKGMECFWNPLKNAFERTGGGLNRNATGGGATAIGGNGSGSNIVDVAAAAAAASSSSGSNNDPNDDSGGVRNSSITKCISEVLTMIKFIEEEWSSKMMILEMTKPVTEFSSDPLLHFMVNCLSSFAVSLISSQLMALNTGTGNTSNGMITVTISRGTSNTSSAGVHSTPADGSSASSGIAGDINNILNVAGEHPLADPPETLIWMDRSTHKKHVMQRDCSGCDCEFYELYLLPCQHLIWYELSVLKNKQVSMSAVGQRWFLRTFQYPKIVSQRESNEEIPGNRDDDSDQERAREAQQGQEHDLVACHLARDQTHEREQISPPLTKTFFSRCFASIANLGTGRTIRAKDNDLFESVQVYPLLLPESYEPIDRTPSLAVVLENIAQQTRENFAVNISVNFFSRVGRWFRLKIHEWSSRTATTYFSNYKSRVIRSLISMLLRACTQEKASLDKLVLQYPRLQQYPIPCAEKQWLQSLVNEVRSKVPLPLKLSEKPYTYLPCLYFVLKEIEKYSQDLNLHDQSGPMAIKVFALLPQKRLRPINIKVTNTVLKELNKELNICRPQLVDMPVHDLWNHYFGLVKSIESKTKNFSHFIVTDGLSASVNLVRRRKASLQVRKESSVDVLFAQADRVVAVDPGRNPVFTAVVHDRRAMHDLAKPYPRNKAKHKNVTKRWSKKAAGIAKFNSEVGTAKTTNLSAIESRARHVLYYLPAVLDFYCARRFRRLKWKTYIRTQKAYCKIVADLSGGSAKTLIVWGDARFPAAGLGNPAVLTCTLRRKLGFRMRIVDQNEFRTSKLCCACHGEMTEYRNPRTNQVP